MRHGRAGRHRVGRARGGGRQRPTASVRSNAPPELPYDVRRQNSSAGGAVPTEAAPGAVPVRVADEPAVDAAKDFGDGYAEERPTHADGTTTIIREYHADGSCRIMSDRREIEFIDNVGDPCGLDPVTVVYLP
jgi:hypothetical protein